MAQSKQKKNDTQKESDTYPQLLSTKNAADLKRSWEPGLIPFSQSSL